jgi:hypothetical protein
MRTCGELGPFVLVKRRDVTSRRMGLFGQVRDDPLLIGLFVVRGHLGILNSMEFAKRLTVREVGIPCGSALSDDAAATRFGMRSLSSTGHVGDVVESRP